MARPSLERLYSHYWLLALIVWLPGLVSSQQVTGTWKYPDGETPGSFQGFFPSTTTAVVHNCASTETWYTSGDVAGCCKWYSECTPATGCSAGVMTYYDSDYGEYSTGDCPTDVGNCVTMTIHESFPAGSGVQSWSNIFCANQWTDYDIYREIVISTPSTSSTTTRTPSVSTTIATSVPTTDSKPSGPAQTSNSALPDPQPTSSSSNAWIAGVVVGPVVGLALVGVLAFWWGKRRVRTELGVAGGGPSIPAISERGNSYHPSYHQYDSPNPGAVGPYVADQDAAYHGTPSPPITKQIQFVGPYPLATAMEAPGYERAHDGAELPGAPLGR